MAGRNVDGEIVLGINQPESQKIMAEDLKRILSTMKDLEVIINHAKLDKTAAQELLKQIQDLQAEITVASVKINQSQAVKNVQQTGQKMGKQMGDNINQGLSKSLRDVKYTIADMLKNFPKLNSFNLFSIFNLNRKDIDSSITKQVHDITKEIETLSTQVLKTNSDSSWQGVIDKIGSLRSILNQFGQVRDISSFKESIELLDYFNNKKIYVGNKDEVLKNTGRTLKELNNEFMNLVKFTTSVKGSIKLDTVWDELSRISPELGKLITFGDQFRALIDQFNIAKNAKFGNSGLISASETNEVPNVLMKYMDILENTCKKLSVLREQQADMEQMITNGSTTAADKILQNEQKKQQAYRETAEEVKKATGDIETAVNNVTSSSVGKYFKVDPSTSSQFRAEMEQLVRDWTNTKGKLTDIKIDTRTSFDKQTGENIERLHQATVTYKNELDEVIKKTVAWRQIGTTLNENGQIEALHGFVEVAGQYSKSLDAVATKTDTFVKQQNRMAASLQNTINQITARAFDQNSSKPITSEQSLAKLNIQAAYVENAMYDLRNATAATFDDAVIKVRNEISELKILESQLRKADNVSTKMKGVDIASGLAIARNDLEKFKADAKDFPQIIQTINELDKSIAKVGDASSLNSFNDQLRVARAELAKVKSETMAVNRDEKVGIQVSGLQSKIADLQRISPEIDKFSAKINGADVTVQSLYSDLAKVNTQSDLSVVNSKFKAFADAAKSAGIAVTEVKEKSGSFFASLKKGFSFLSYYTSLHYIFMQAVRGIKEVVSNVNELDSALTNIAYTMDVSGSQLKQIGESSLQAAKDLNTSVSKILDAVKTYANAQETAESIIEKSKPTIMMSNVTGMDTNQTVDILQGVMEQFDLTEDQLMHISDVMQTVSMSMPYDFANGVKELSEGIKASGIVAKDAGYDLENYTALLGTLIAKTRQSGGELGRSLRTMFVRTTKASTSALANGEVTEDDLSNAEKALRRVGIEVRSDINTFKSFDQIMGELYEKVDSLSDVDLSNIAYEVASTRQTNVFKMMIKAYGDYQEMAEQAYNAENVTLINQQKYAESLAGKMGELSAVWEKIGDDAVSSDFLKGLADAGIAVSSLIEKVGLLKSVIAGVGIAAFVKNFA